MAEPLAISSALSSLLPLVRESLAIVKDVFRDDKKLRDLLARVELHKTYFTAWETSWVDSTGKTDLRFRVFAATKPLLARGVLKQFVSLLKITSDPDKLYKKCGLRVEKLKPGKRGEDVAAELRHVSDYLGTVDNKFSIKGIAAFEASRVKHLAFLQNLRYVIIGKVFELEDLIGRVEDFVRDLQIFTPDPNNEVASRAVFELAVRDLVKDHDYTRRLAEAAAIEKKASIDPDTKEKYDSLIKFATFATGVKNASAAAMPAQKLFTRRDFSFDGPFKLGANTTLARLFDYPTRHQTRIVLVEWVTAPKPAQVKAKFDELKMEWYVLNAEKPDSLLLPVATGLIYDNADPHVIGIIYQLPSHIRTELPPKPVAGRAPDPRLVRSPKTVAAQRMPTTLRQLIERSRSFDLGLRFKIAKKLLDSLHLMHTGNWIHRKIRSDHIIFFPSQARDGEPDPTRLDFDTPLLVGFHAPRLELDVGAGYEAPKPLEHIRPLQPIANMINNKTRIIAVDAYQHPDHRRNVDAPYRRQYDLYSVGVVLLELGLWDTVENLEKRDIAARGYHPTVVPSVNDILKDADVIAAAAKKLDSITGSIYANVVRDCLSLKPIVGDTLEVERQLASDLARVEA
ncbi:hypothetical protein QBC35DRAFT_208831 [Podospora australis]|uniref:Protein kinase domain-containing protein n=1 Tax=Podospora australis TaxID=1536484 RepID=A0AAN7AIW7_9PEZI|nr:hypothetical protein QBC35DRAFT_208831 [Podospora australis]